MSSRAKSTKRTPVKSKPKKLDQSLPLKRPKEERAKAALSVGKGSPGQNKAVARIPTSRENSSSNWKALLQKQGRSLPSPSSSGNCVSSPRPTMNTPNDKKRCRNSQGSESRSVSTERSRSASQPRCPSQLSMASGSSGAEGEACGGAISKDPSQKVKQEFRALGLSETKAAERQSRGIERGQKSTPRRVTKKLPPDGLNEFGYFDYTHYGVLKTPITTAHEEFMLDSGIIAMDCEMVGVGPMKESALARVSIVNEYGYCLYDRFVKPKLEVTDYRTEFSGIRENDLKNALPFQLVAKEVSEILRGHILVGHSLKSDLAVLYLNHPKPKMRDTAAFFKKILHSRTPKLKVLVKKLLGVDIQEGEHSSITDAQATMALYRMYQKDWEISARQTNRGIDVLKQTLEEFKLMRSGPIVASQSQPLYFPNSQQVATGDWYDSPDAYNSTFCNSLYTACSEGCCDDSVGASPSESPVIAMDSIGYSIEDNVYPCQQVLEEIPMCHSMPTNFTLMQYPMHPAPITPIPPTSVSLPFYQYGAMNGMIIPPMSFPPTHEEAGYSEENLLHETSCYCGCLVCCMHTVHLGNPSNGAGFVDRANALMYPPQPLPSPQYFPPSSMMIPVYRPIPYFP